MFYCDEINESAGRNGEQEKQNPVVSRSTHDCISKWWAEKSRLREQKSRLDSRQYSNSAESVNNSDRESEVKKSSVLRWNKKRMMCFFAVVVLIFRYFFFFYYLYKCSSSLLFLYSPLFNFFFQIQYKQMKCIWIGNIKSGPFSISWYTCRIMHTLIELRMVLFYFLHFCLFFANDSNRIDLDEAEQEREKKDEIFIRFIVCCFFFVSKHFVHSIRSVFPLLCVYLIQMFYFFILFLIFYLIFFCRF